MSHTTNNISMGRNLTPKALCCGHQLKFGFFFLLNTST